MLGIITRLNIFHSRNHILNHKIFRLLQRPFAKKSAWCPARTCLMY